MAFTVAIGAEGCPDTNANTKNANGTIASPNAMNADRPDRDRLPLLLG
jgi:hypothetical protein